jgi:hypothetical protein
VGSAVNNFLVGNCQPNCDVYCSINCTCSVNGGINKLKEDFLNPEYEEKNPQDRHLLNTFKNEILKQNK